jgi:hypothetical protein
VPSSDFLYNTLFNAFQSVTSVVPHLGEKLENGSSNVKPFELHDRLAFLQRHAPELVKACHVR